MNEPEASAPDADSGLAPPLPDEPPETTAPPEPAPPPAAPVNEAERLHSLDILRGVAVLGILYMNVQSFSMPDPAYSVPVAWGDFTGANYYVWLVGRLFADQKFMTIFSMLFGAGIVLMSERIEARGRAAAGVHYRRMIVLLAFGLLHSYLLWTGDVLYHYALCGMLVFPLRVLRPRALIATAAGLLIVGTFCTAAIGFAVSLVSAGDVDALKWNSPETIAETMAQVEAYRSSYAGQMPQRAFESFYMHTLAFGFFMLWRVTAVMLLGMALYKLGVLSARRSPAAYAALLVVGASIGLPIEILGIRHMIQNDWSYIAAEVNGFLYNYWASLGVALAWTAAVMIGCHRLAERALDPPATAARALLAGSLAYRFSCVGRMAFTNYIAQTLICTTIFYGHGLGLYGHVERTGQLAVVLAVWLAQLLYSPLWLHYFRMGPLEWLWRTLTYARLQPLRRT